MINELYIALI